jgi:thymidylate kinase
MINKIIITEGLDRCGKSTALRNLENFYKNSNFEVETIFCQSITRNKELTEIYNKSYSYIAEARKNLDRHLVYDLFSLGSIEMVSRILLPLHNSSKQYVVLIDRFALSNFVYGKVLRSDKFNKTFEHQKEQLAKYIESVFLSLAIYAPIHCFIATRPTDFLEFEDDNENELIKVSKSSMYEINQLFKDMMNFCNYIEKHQPETLHKIKFYAKEIETFDIDEFYHLMMNELNV